MKKIILGIVIGIVLCSGVVCAFNYSASDISYSNEELDVENVNDALDNLYLNMGAENMSTFTNLYNYAGPSGSGTASAYVTKSYKYTEEDANNDYQYLILSISRAAATDLMYGQTSEISVISNSMKLISKSTSGNTVSALNQVYLINAKDVKPGDSIFSIKFRGLYIINLVGVK